MKNFLNLFPFPSPTRPFSTTNILSSDPADTDKIDYTHNTSDIFRGWLCDEFDFYRSKLNLSSTCLQRVKYFKDRYVYVAQQKPGTKILLSLNLRLVDGSFIQILPLVNITDVSDDILDIIIKANLSIRIKWFDSKGFQKVTHILTKGRLIFDDDPINDPYNDDDLEDLPNTMLATSLCGKYYDPETKTLDWIGFLKWKYQIQ
jgi:hypothetical protein